MLLDFAAPFNRLYAALQRSPAPPPVPLDSACPLSHPHAPLPAWVADDPVVQKYRALLGELPWQLFPERPTDRPWPGPKPQPRAPFAAAYLVKLHEGKRFMSDLRTFLCEHPALVYWLGFERLPDPSAPHGFAVAQSVPKRRHFSTLLRELPNPSLQFLLSASIHLLKATLPPEQQSSFGDIIAGDTQALLAWVAENNPKQYIKEGRLDKERQPKADPDCKLGVKHRRNHAPADADGSEPATPSTDAKPASTLQVGSDIFWGYASGVVATRLPNGTEVVLAERTRPRAKTISATSSRCCVRSKRAWAAARATARGIVPSTPTTSTTTLRKQAALRPCGSMRARRAPSASSPLMDGRCVRLSCR
jgi:hypothetical protein